MIKPASGAIQSVPHQVDSEEVAAIESNLIWPRLMISRVGLSAQAAFSFSWAGGDAGWQILWTVLKLNAIQRRHVTSPFTGSWRTTLLAKTTRPAAPVERLFIWSCFHSDASNHDLGQFHFHLSDRSSNNARTDKPGSIWPDTAS